MNTQLCVHNFCKGSNKYPIGTSYPAELNAKMKKKKYIFYEKIFENIFSRFENGYGIGVQHVSQIDM